MALRSAELRAQKWDMRPEFRDPMIQAIMMKTSSAALQAASQEVLRARAMAPKSDTTAAITLLSAIRPARTLSFKEGSLDLKQERVLSAGLRSAVTSKRNIMLST